MVGVCQAEQLADDWLVAVAQGGSARAFDLLVVRHHAAILRYLAQVPFLHAFRTLDRLGDDRGFAVWLTASPATTCWRRGAGNGSPYAADQLPLRGPELRGAVLRVAGRGRLLAPAGPALW